MGEGAGEREGTSLQAVTKLMQVQALRHTKNTRTAEIQYCHLYYVVYMMILLVLNF